MADQRLFNHGQKNRPIHTIAYEIEMWRRSYAAIKPTWEALSRTKSDDDLYEHNLRIEGFLLHTRNLLGFLTDDCVHKTDDLRITQPTTWTEKGEDVEQQVWQSFIDRAKKVNDDHRDKAKSCYEDISKYLSHCTSLRHKFKEWNSDAIFSDLNVVVSDFEKRFITTAPQEPEVRVTRTLGGSTHHTGSFSVFKAPLVE